MSVVEEEWEARANAVQVAHIRSLLDMNPVQVYDLSSRTAELRKMMVSESCIIGYERFLKKKHHACVK